MRGSSYRDHWNARRRSSRSSDRGRASRAAGIFALGALGAMGAAIFASTASGAGGPLEQVDGALAGTAGRVAVVAGGVTAAVAGAVPCEQANGLRLPTGTVIADAGGGAELPPRGHGVDVQLYSVDGTQDLGVEHQRDGGVRVLGCDSEQSPGGQGAPDGAAPAAAHTSSSTGGVSPPACKDNGYRLNDYKWYQPLVWRFRAASRPNGLGVRATKAAIKAGTQSITRARNGCGLGPDLSAKQRYRGQTRRGANIVHPGSHPLCSGRPDGISVTDFGRLPRTFLGGACTWTVLRGGRYAAVESDVRLDKEHFRWTLHPQRRSCFDAYSVKAVITHERGHSFGLDDLSAREHANLVMSDVSKGPCQYAEHTLGLGDVRGLARRYGTRSGGTTASAR